MLGINFAQNFPGVGLPTTLFGNYSYLVQNLAINNDVKATCTAAVGGQCIINKPCSNLPGDFKNLAFEIIFATKVIRVPLSNFFVSSSDNTQCLLGVQYLDIDDPQGRNVIFGGNFWTTFQANVTNTYSVQTYTYQNQYIAIKANADSMLSFAGNTTLPLGPNPFLPKPVPKQYNCEINPTTFMPELYGSFNSSDFQTYLIDNNAKYTLVWSTNCQQELAGSGVKNCSQAPTYVNEWYNLNQSFITPNPMSSIQGGYEVSGNVVTAEMIIPFYLSNDSDNLTIPVIAVTDISADSWLSNVQNQPSGQFAAGASSNWTSL